MGLKKYARGVRLDKGQRLGLHFQAQGKRKALFVPGHARCVHKSETNLSLIQDKRRALKPPIRDINHLPLQPGLHMKTRAWKGGNDMPHPAKGTANHMFCFVQLQRRPALGTLQGDLKY
jgi:hypothetical protein